MDANFWLERWQRQQIGFHAHKPNVALARYWPAMARAGSRVLVPLCGKSLDMAWLAARGHWVVGVELSPLAVEAFFAEQGLPYEVEARGQHQVYRSGAIEIWQGDLFALSAEDIGPCTALYDRAALIALPPELRAAYVAHLGQLLPEGSLGLLVALEYPQHKLGGPPFSVLAEEVEQLYAPHWRVQPLETIDALHKAAPRFHQAGVERLVETVYGLCKR
ncbi:thiopurine S-methyltransferase [Pseudomonas sp. NPDC007930]|uniref:thiopurine S-methyltransferase n=1 Tax=Pseudomonas sp. NPDC007930 TaxID=3364417 RepID=UPI0036E7C7C3